MLQTVNLSKDFGGVPALDGVSIHVEPGEVYVLLGANGAGKTTLINLFLNFLDPSEGQALVNGLDVTRHPIETKRYIGYIPEQVMLYGSLSGVENLDYFARLAGRRLSPEELIAFLGRAGLSAQGVVCIAFG